MIVVVRSGLAAIGVVSAPVLLAVGSGPWVVSSAMDEVTLIVLATPTPQGLIGRTANVRVLEAAALSEPTVSVQTVPPGAPLAQLQPGEDPAASNVALTGTVAVRTTPVAVALPSLMKLMTYGTSEPGVAVIPPSDMLVMWRSIPESVTVEVAVVR